MFTIAIINRKTANSSQSWYFQIKAKNGQVLAHSEKYANRVDCVNAAKIVMAGTTRPIEDVVYLG